jgi:hypothetical protein
VLHNIRERKPEWSSDRGLKYDCADNRRYKPDESIHWAKQHCEYDRAQWDVRGQVR